jgi:hypothetical protein
MGGEGKEEMMMHLSKDIHINTQKRARDSQGMEVGKGRSHASTFINDKK